MNLGNENEYQEFKEGLGQLDKGLKSITSMLNKHGSATVYFGVDDNGNNYIKVTANGSDIPYSFDGRYYLRNVSADEKASNDVLRKMLASSDSDILSQKTSPVQDLTFTSLFGILAGNGIHPKPTSQFYSNYALLNRESKFNMNAYLLSDNNEISIKVVVFEGLDKSVMSKRTEYGNKCLLVSISEVMQFFETINITDVNLDSPLRKEVPLFDFPSFREAWINAGLHNDWKNGLSPSIYMFDDRIEIVSYGGLPFSLSKEGFFNGTSVPVNKSLLTIFMAAEYAEQSGHGIPTIVEKYGRDVFSFDDGMVKVTIPLAFELPEVTARKRNRLLQDEMSESQIRVYRMLKENGRLSLNSIAEKTGLSIIGVKKICSKLKELGLLERIGSSRNGKWVTK